MSNVKTSTVNSFPLGIILFLIFMTLKLCGVITWSWIWVTAPIWAPILFVLLVLALIFLVACGVTIMKPISKK